MVFEQLWFKNVFQSFSTQSHPCIVKSSLKFEEKFDKSLPIHLIFLFNFSLKIRLKRIFMFIETKREQLDRTIDEA